MNWYHIGDVIVEHTPVMILPIIAYGVIKLLGHILDGFEHWFRDVLGYSKPASRRGQGSGAGGPTQASGTP